MHKIIITTIVVYVIGEHRVGVYLCTSRTVIPHACHELTPTLFCPAVKRALLLHHNVQAEGFTWNRHTTIRLTASKQEI